MIYGIRIIPHNYSEKKVECINNKKGIIQYPDLMRYNFFGTGIYLALSKESRKTLADAYRAYQKVRRIKI